MAAAALESADCTCTAVLTAAAVPAWRVGHRQPPRALAGSATDAATGIALLSSPVAEVGPRRAVRRGQRGGGSAEGAVHGVQHGATAGLRSGMNVSGRGDKDLPSGDYSE